MYSEVYERKVDTPDEPLSPILNAAAGINIREDQLRRTECDLRECSKADCGIFRHLL